MLPSSAGQLPVRLPILGLSKGTVCETPPLCSTFIVGRITRKPVRRFPSLGGLCVDKEGLREVYERIALSAEDGFRAMTIDIRVWQFPEPVEGVRWAIHPIVFPLCMGKDYPLAV